MTETVLVLEAIRLGLLRLHAGDGSVESVTAVLGDARDIRDDIKKLLDGRDEVEKLLKARRDN